MPATSAQPGSATNSPWSDPYRVVYRALKLRDRARASAKTSDDQATVARGSAKLDDAREAWSDRKYDAAEQFARAAIADFRTVIDQAEAEPKSDGEPKRSAEELARAADAALREAKVTLQVCERDKCEERDFAELTRARELIKSADEASKAGRHAYAEELAGQARDKLTAILAKPRPKAPAPKEVDPEAKRKAEDGMREAEIAKKLCESRSCSAIDLEAWLRAQQNLAAAQSAIADGDPERALRLSEQAREGFTAIVKPTPQKPAFVIPSEVQRVSRSGSQLYLDPPIDFRTGSVALDAESQPTIEQLAKVLAANKDLVKRVRIVGFTDNRGNQALNKSLSAARAEAVRKALAGLGVDAASMVSEGRGSESPIADNATAEGRKANRRVEIQLELQ